MPPSPLVVPPLTATPTTRVSKCYRGDRADALARGWSISLTQDNSYERHMWGMFMTVRNFCEIYVSINV